MALTYDPILGTMRKSDNVSGIISDAPIDGSQYTRKMDNG